MNEMISTIILLFLIIDPLGNLPIFMSTLKHIDPKRRQAIVIREMLIALFIMVLFLFSGEYLLSFLHLRTETVSISGGIILFLIAIKMIFPLQENNTFNLLEKEPFLVPLAIPLVAGPSILATLMLLSNQYTQHITKLAISLFIAWALSMFILMLSNIFLRILKTKGINALERLMGLLLIMLSIQMFLEGFRIYLHN